MDRMLVIFKKEYFQKVKSLGFWLTTILMPVFMFGIMIVPMLLMTRQKPTITVTVVDPGGVVYPALLAAQEERSEAVEQSNSQAGAAAIDRQAQVDVVFKKSAGEAPEILIRGSTGRSIAR